MVNASGTADIPATRSLPRADARSILTAIEMISADHVQRVRCQAALVVAESRIIAEHSHIFILLVAF